MGIKVLCVTGIALLGAFATAQADQELAHSKSLDMSFTAIGEPWCASSVNMRVQAQDPAKFSTDDYGTIIRKLGQVLGGECPQVESIAITGLAAGQNVWSGTARKADGWEARQQPTGSTSPAPADSKPIAAAAPVATVTATPEPAPVAVETKPEPIPQPTAAAGQPAAEPAPSVPAMSAPTPAKDTKALEIAGWRPGGLLLVGEDARPMTEIPAQENGCRIRTFHDIRPELDPSYTMNREFSCENGYAQSVDLRRQARATLFYHGQKQPFGQLNGYWFDGYTLDRGRPRQIVARYKSIQRDNYQRRAIESDKLLVWLGEDRELRAHYFTTYTHDSRYNLWRLDAQSPYIVLTDSETLLQQPDKTGLAQSLAELNKNFLGYNSIDQFANVGFVIVDQLHNAPGHKQLDASIANLDESLHKQGQALRPRGMPWYIEVKNDYAAMRSARAEAEQRRVEAEQQRLAALRVQHQTNLDNQYRQLAEASPYDRLRFYATLMLNRQQLDQAKIDFTANRAYAGNPLNHAVMLAHPAQFANQARDGEVALGAPLYLLVEADDGDIEKPYPMKVDYNESPASIDGWMLVRLAPKFGFGFDDKGKPVFEVTVQEAVACTTEHCMKDLDVTGMMQTWYGDQDMNFAMTEQR